MAKAKRRTKRGSGPPGSGVFLRSIELDAQARRAAQEFPFSVPIVRALDTLEFPTAVTFLVGENGSGKSTLLEGIAAATHLAAIGSDTADQDPTLTAARALAEKLTLTWDRRTRTGFFLRAEDFFGFVKRLSALRAEMNREIGEATAEYRSQDRSAWALGLRVGPLGRSLAEIYGRYGGDLDALSHGESFLTLLQARFVPGGLYLLDEPEAALSPQSQLALITILADMVAQGAQFIVATHSPILLALPDATIYSFDRVPVSAVAYDDLDHVVLTRGFLAEPARYLRHLGPRKGDG